MEDVKRLYWQMVFARPGFWVHQFQLLEEGKDPVSDPARATKLLGTGRECIANNRPERLQHVVREYWALLPIEVAEAGRRGYQSGVVR
jgi:hypothetical protein